MKTLENLSESDKYWLGNFYQTYLFEENNLFLEEYLKTNKKLSLEEFVEIKKLNNIKTKDAIKQYTTYLEEYQTNIDCILEEIECKNVNFRIVLKDDEITEIVSEHEWNSYSNISDENCIECTLLDLVQFT